MGVSGPQQVLGTQAGRRDRELEDATPWSGWILVAFRLPRSRDRLVGYRQLHTPLADCDEAVRLDPKDPAIHLIRGIILANKGELGPAFREVIFHPLLRNSPTPVKLLALQQ